MQYSNDAQFPESFLIEHLFFSCHHPGSKYSVAMDFNQIFFFNTVILVINKKRNSKLL